MDEIYSIYRIDYLPAAQKDKKKTASFEAVLAHSRARSYWIGVERNHTVLLLYVYVFILSTTFFSAYIIRCNGILALAYTSGRGHE